ncbi:MAG: hypothetical protein M3R02_31770, partial [Chloroflexota bacterium]|nr:hypothetical protein [Chloroflexota bacterium]
GFLTEDRKAEGLVLPQAIRDNALLALRSLGRATGRRRGRGRGQPRGGRSCLLGRRPDVADDI